MSRELNLRIADRELVAEGIVSLGLVRAEGGALPPWQPGAHIELELPGGLLRQYSLCSDPGERDRWRIAVLHEPEGRGGSVIVHDRLAVGDLLQAGSPRNNFVSPDAAPWRPSVAPADRPAVLFVAGGIGITPVLPMVRAAVAAGVDWHLLYLGRRLETMAFRGELAAFGDRVLLHPRGEDGALDLEAELARLCLPSTAIFACGPQRLLDAVEEWCSARHGGAESRPRLHVEKFTPVEAVREGDTAFEVEIADGTVIEVSADESILAAMTRCRIPALNSCREGNCGTCETFVLEGVPEHRDNVLSGEERASGETMMICVSRSLSGRLVLDL